MNDGKMGLSTEHIEDSLQQFGGEVTGWTSRGDIETPWPTLRIIGHRNREGMWQSFFEYFCNPARPHGFRGKVIDAMLEKFTAAGAFENDLVHPDWGRIEIESEVHSPSGDGRPDLLIWDSGRWFICIEMKVDSEEHGEQLSRYATAEEIGIINTDDYPANRQFFIYITTRALPSFPQDPSAQPKARFTVVTWDRVVDALDRVLDRSLGRYPNRSAMQLDDIRSTIAEKMNMDENENYVKIKDAYIEHRKAIKQANEAGEEFVAKHLAHDWAEAIQDTHKPDFWDQTWKTHVPNSDSPNYGQIYRTPWKSDEVDLHFEHKPRWRYFRDGRLQFRLDIEKSGERRDAIIDTWNSISDEIPIPETTTMEISGKKYLLAAEKSAYDYTPGDCESYFRALSESMEDHEPLFAVIDRLIEKPPDQYPEVGDSFYTG